MADDFTEKVAT